MSFLAADSATGSRCTVVRDTPQSGLAQCTPQTTLTLNDTGRPSAKETPALSHTKTGIAMGVKLVDRLPNNALPVTGEFYCSEMAGRDLVEGSRHSRGGARRSQRFCQ